MKNLFLIVILFTFTLSVFAKEDTPLSKPLSKEDEKVLEIGEVTTTQYVVGGVLGIYPGFGLGHAVQGRYISDNGWIFTVGEVVSLTMMMSGFTKCVGEAMSGNKECHSNTGAFGVLGFIGFKIWEVIDVWVAPPRINKRYHELKGKNISELQLAPMINPENKSGGLQLSFNF